MVNTKKTFLFIFLLLAIILLILPPLTTLSEFLANIFYQFGWYRVIANFVVPQETRIIAGFLQLLGYQVQAAPKTISIFRDGAWETVGISWNCIGWQSLILFIITLFVGLQGNFTKATKIECIIIGLLGTFLVNLFRIAGITWLIFNFNVIPAMVLHDYLSTFLIIIWLFVFWWFSYAFVLRQKHRNMSEWGANASE